MIMKKMYGKQCVDLPERGGGDGEASEVCGLLGLERISLIVLGHRGKYAGCLSPPESLVDAANTAKTHRV